MAVQVAIFNTSPFAIQLSVNHGGPISIAGTSPAQNWVPQQPTSNAPTFDYNPRPGGFGMGQNMVNIQESGRSEMVNIYISPRGPVSSLQLYVFPFQGWVLLIDGIWAAQGSSTQPFLAAEMPQSADATNEEGKQSANSLESASS